MTKTRFHGIILCRKRQKKSDEKTALPIRCLSNFRETSGNIRKKAFKNGKIVTKRDERSLNHIYSKSVCVKAHMGSNPILSATYGVGSNIPAPFSVEKLCPV